MIGRVIEEDGQKVIQTLAGATAGTVCKVNYGADSNYAIPLTLNEAGEGYIGISCACPGPFYNPVTGTLTVDNICSISSEAENANKVKSNSLTGDTVYNLAIWCATSDGCYNSMGFSGGRSITYNPYTATLNACNGNFAECVTTTNLCVGSTLVADGLTIENPQGCFIGCIAGNGKLAWDCGAHFADATVCIDNLTVTNTINGIACEANGTHCYNCYCLDYMSVSADRPLLMTNASDASNAATVGSIGRATNCRLTFNPNSGILKIANANGCFGGRICANALTVGTQGITTYYDIVGYDDSATPRQTWYIYCDGSACLYCIDVCCGGDICVFGGGNIYVCNGECPVISTATIGNYLTCQCRVSLETYLACSSLCSNVLYLVY